MDIKPLGQKVQKSLDSEKVTPFTFWGILLAALVVGAVIGYGINRMPKSSLKSTLSGGSMKKTEGVMDKKQFPDTATGVLKEGGLDGEGNFHLERPGGESQNVYLTSSVIDLSKYVGRKIKVGGQTFQGQKAGWLMDVGYVEVQ